MKIQETIERGDQFIHIPSGGAFVCEGTDEGYIWYNKDGHYELQKFDAGDCKKESSDIKKQDALPEGKGKSKEECLSKYIERPFRHTEIVEKGNALKAMDEYLASNLPKEKEAGKFPSFEEMKSIANNNVNEKMSKVQCYFDGLHKMKDLAPTGFKPGFEEVLKQESKYHWEVANDISRAKAVQTDHILSEYQKFAPQPTLTGEISDEEIEKHYNELWKAKPIGTITKMGFVAGATWYRSELKSRSGKERNNG